MNEDLLNHYNLEFQTVIWQKKLFNVDYKYRKSDKITEFSIFKIAESWNVRKKTYLTENSRK